jgi:hypothetical protein
MSGCLSQVPSRRAPWDVLHLFNRPNNVVFCCSPYIKAFLSVDVEKHVEQNWINRIPRPIDQIQGAQSTGIESHVLREIMSF